MNPKQLLKDIDEAECLRSLVHIKLRLEELGWRDIIYCPTDGTHFLAIEFGVPVPGVCFYDGEWPHGRWWMVEQGDLFPAKPIMWKLPPSESE